MFFYGSDLYLSSGNYVLYGATLGLCRLRNDSKHFVAYQHLMWDVDIYEFEEQERCMFWNNSRKYYASLGEK